MSNRVIGAAALTGCLISWNAGAAPCEPKDLDTSLETRDGYVEFIAPDKLRPFKEALPRVENAAVQTLIQSPDTMWYDEESMVFLYQDSVEVVVGGRANCVGRKVGERNRDNDIGRLLNYFGPDYRFKYPFRTAAGTDNVTNIHVINFWAPPKRDGRVMPVKWWQSSSRGRWHWVFPVGTVFGEVLYEKGPGDRWYAFELRTRTRYRDGWQVDLFRPFTTATGFADAIIAKRPDWQESPDLSQLVSHLQDRNNLVRHKLESEAYSKVFPPIDGALDLLPAIGDTATIAELLKDTTFKSAEGAIWKEGNGLETYAPGSQGEFSLVPKGYELGMIPVNEVSCTRCHVETGHELGDFEFKIVLYGEMWGEDRIFTWHLYEPNQYVYDTWDDADVPSRKVNPRMDEAKLLKNERPSASDPDYKQLPVPY